MREWRCLPRNGAMQQEGLFLLSKKKKKKIGLFPRRAVSSLWRPERGRVCVRIATKWGRACKCVCFFDLPCLPVLTSIFSHALSPPLHPSTTPRYLFPVHFSPAPSPPPSWPLLWGGSLGVSFLFCSPLSNAIFSLSTFDFHRVSCPLHRDWQEMQGHSRERGKKKIIIHDTVFILALPPSFKNVSSFLSPSSFLLSPSVFISTKILTKCDPCQQKSQHALIPRQNCWKRLLYSSASLTHWPEEKKKLGKFYLPGKVNDLQWQAFVKNTDLWLIKKEICP